MGERTEDPPSVMARELTLHFHDDIPLLRRPCLPGHSILEVPPSSVFRSVNEN